MRFESIITYQKSYKVSNVKKNKADLQ